MRWAEELIGRNSVRPWTSPRTTASSALSAISRPLRRLDASGRYYRLAHTAERRPRSRRSDAAPVYSTAVADGPSARCGRSKPTVSADDVFSAADREQLARRGIESSEAGRQLALLRDPPPPLALDRPCRVEDGIARLAAAETEPLVAEWAQAAAGGRLSKFVPASGAASRMFAAIGWYLERASGAALPGRAELERLREAGDPNAAGVLAVAAGLEKFAFSARLATLLGERERSFGELRTSGDLTEALALVYGRDGLGLASLPKGLLPFHRYPEGERSAFEEHFVEAIGYLTRGGGRCRIHFTVSPEHVEAFEAAFRDFRGPLEAAGGVALELGLSTQEPSTDTLAIGADGRPERQADGSLLLRPAGHGALLGNLERLEAEVVFIKNIDNVAPARLQEPTVRWKRLLAGHLLHLQRRLFELLDALEAGGGERHVAEALGFLEASFALRVAPAVRAASVERRRLWALDRLDRPIRVCGVVPNVGEPGGGPFWVRGADGVSGQIVEGSQIDRADPDQLAIWGAATHFNPVDLVCALRDRHGRPFRLSRFVDPATAFVARKLHGARRIRALERPGLWNGAMAGWNTAFVEVPLETFNPVKTLADLLRPEHLG